MTPTPLAVLFVTLAAVAPAYAADPVTPASPSSRPASRTAPDIRFLCMADDAPLRYVKGPGGSEVPVFAAFDEDPPNTLYVKRDGAFKPAPLPRNLVGKPHSDTTGRAGKIEGYFIKTFAAEDFATAWAKSSAAMSAAQKGAAPAMPESKPQKDDWAQLAAAPAVDGKDYLVCLYQPSTKLKWFPPKVRYVDISPKQLPAGSVLVANFSDREAYVRLGADAPLKLPVDGQVVVPMPGGAGKPVSVALAALARDGKSVQLMAPPRQRVLPPGHAGVIGVYSLYEKTSDKPVGVRFTTYEVPPPLVKP